MSGQLGAGELGKFQLGTPENTTPALGGTLVATSQVSANLLVHVPLTGTVASTSVWPAPTLTISYQAALQGTVAGQSALSASLHVGPAVHLEGTLTCQSTMTALFALTLPLQGTVQAQTLWQATFALTEALTGSISGHSSWNAHLTPILHGVMINEGIWTAASIQVQSPLEPTVLQGTSTWSAIPGFATPIHLSATLSGSATMSGFLGFPGITLVADASQQFGQDVVQIAETLDILEYDGFNGTGITIQPQTAYHVSAYVSTPAQFGQGTLIVANLSGTALYSQSFTATPNWSRVDLPIPTGNTESLITVQIGLTNAQGVMRATAFMVQKGILLTPWNLSQQELLYDNAINTALLAPSAVTGDKVASATLTGQNIAGGTVTGDNIASATITGQNISGNSITGDLIAAQTITGQNIAAGTITSSLIASQTITATNIASQTITSQQIAAATITGQNIAAATISGGNIVAGSITGGNIAAGTLTATNIAAGTITGNLIAAQTITANNIVSNTITGALIAAGTITASNIASQTITASQIAANTITGTNIAASSVSADVLNGGTIDATNITVTNLTYTNITSNGLLGYDNVISATSLQIWNTSTEFVELTIQTNQGAEFIFQQQGLGRLYLSLFDNSIATGNSGMGGDLEFWEQGVAYWDVTHYVDDAGGTVSSADYLQIVYDPGGLGVITFYGDGQINTGQGAVLDNGDGFSYSYGLQSAWFGDTSSVTFSYSRAFPANPNIAATGANGAVASYTSDSTSSVSVEGSVTTDIFVLAAYNFG